MSTHDIVKPIIVSTGQLLKDLFGESVSSYEKERRHLTCDADQRIEDMICQSLAKEFPGYSICSEECGIIAGDDSHRWIIDPIDGTAYFICGVPYFSMSISLEIDGRITEAYVYNPVSDEFYYGSEEGSIATLNGEPISVSNVESIHDARIAVGFSANKAQIDRYFADWGTILDSCKKGIGLLSPALNICNVARGRLDLFVDNGSSMEGHSGAALILRLVGGVVSNYDLTEWDHRTTGIVAANHSLWDILSKRRSTS